MRRGLRRNGGPGDPARDGAFAQLLALDHPERVRSLVLISTSLALPADRDLPGPTGELGRFVSGARVDWSDSD